MQWSRVLLSVIFSCAAIAVVGQAPIKIEPQLFQINVYPNTGISAYPTRPTPTIPVYSPGLGAASPEEQRRYAEEDIRQHRIQMAERQRQIDEASSEIDAMHIDHQFPFNNLPEKKLYFDALHYFEKVLNDEEPISLEASVFFVEHAYDPSLSYDEFSKQLGTAANVIGLKMQQDKISPNDNVGKIMTAFRFMSDTISVYSKNTETKITTYPKTYDFDDFWGRQNYKKMFVSKLMKEGNGQCHSLPLYFLILCERIHADANLAFAPNHSFIKFKDKRGSWHNMELTNGMLASDHFMVESGYIKAEALQSKIYLQPLTKKQAIVQCVNDLALGYIKKFGYDMFVQKCTTLAIDHDTYSLSAHQINANYFMTLDSYIQYQYKVKGISKEVYLGDEKAKTIHECATGANKFIEKLGYTDMPQNVYEAWLKSAQNEANKQRHAKEVKVLGGMMEIK